ncbi:M48 family metalloprotease [Deinococcus sp. HMF7620]|uniref:M48 family metalloprotease n=1 Tax=Deinococcus arboris TaxID=2682977 RepID=A0A7C9M9W9_9DEIO|nr:M48 family metalloprotease [Deinococcus arboris]
MTSASPVLLHPEIIQRDSRLALGILLCYWIFFMLVSAALLWVIIALAGSGLPALLRWGALLMPAGLLLHLWWTSFPRRRPAPFGTPVALDSEPDLKALIESVAHALNVPMPAEVRLLPDMNAYMSVQGGRSTLGLGLPLLLSLSGAEVKAVIAHELAHVGGGDAARAWRLAGLASGMFRTALSLRQGSPERAVELLPQGLSTAVVLYLLLGNLLALPMTALARAYLRVSERLNHAQEHAADQAAERVAGAAAAHSALRRIAVEAHLFDAYVAQEVVPLAQAGFRVPLAEGFQMFLRGEQAERLRGWTAQDLPEREATLSHPSLRARLDRLEAPLPEDWPPAEPSSLLGQADRWSEAFYVPASVRALRPVLWDDLNTAHWPPHWQALSQSETVRAALRGVTLLDVPVICADLNAHLRVRFTQLQYEGVGGDERHALVAWLALGVLLAALRQGACAHVQPGHPWAAQAHGQTLTPEPLLWQMVMQPAARAAWPDQMAALGLRDSLLLDGE